MLAIIENGFAARYGGWVVSDVIEKLLVQTSRWRVTIFYRSDNGLIDVEHGVEELSEIEPIVERGPNWNTIERIEIKLDTVGYVSLTLEKVGDL